MKRAFGLGVLAWFPLCGTGIGAVIDSGPLNVPIPDNSTGIYINAVTGGIYNGPGFTPPAGDAAFNWDVNLFGSTSSTEWDFSAPTSVSQTSSVPTTSRGYVSLFTGSTEVAALGAGTVVSSASPFNLGLPFATRLTSLSGAPMAFGFRFRNEGADLSTTADDTVHFGYAILAIPVNGVSVNGTLLRYAYESVPLAPITVVPEPGTVTGGAGLGLCLLRRRR